MPNAWTGTPEERMERLSKANRRCDGNSRHCTRAAVDVYEIKAADGSFNVLPDAELETKKSCAYHRAQFLLNGRWVVLTKRPLPRDTRKQQRRPAA